MFKSIFCFAFLVSLIAAAQPGHATEGGAVQFFPPSGCTAGQLKVIAWDGTSTTVCLSGDELLTRLDFPGCSDGQMLVYRDYGRQPVGTQGSAFRTGFYCENPMAATATFPTCAAGEFLTTETMEGKTSLVCKAATATATAECCGDCHHEPPPPPKCEGVLARGESIVSYDTNNRMPSASKVWNFQTPCTGILHANITVGSATSGTLATAATIAVDGVRCGADSYDTLGSTSNGSAAASCSVYLKAGTHKLRFDHQLLGSGAWRREQYIHWQVVGVEGDNLIAPGR